MKSSISKFLDKEFVKIEGEEPITLRQVITMTLVTVLLVVLCGVAEYIGRMPY